MRATRKDLPSHMPVALKVTSCSSTVPRMTTFTIKVRNS